MPSRTGGLLGVGLSAAVVASRMVTARKSVTPGFVPSDAVRARMTVASASTSGSVISGFREVALVNAIPGDGGNCSHEYVRESPSGSLAVALSASEVPSPRDTSGPASTAGAGCPEPAAAAAGRWHPVW